jgi:hypothetical protein
MAGIIIVGSGIIGLVSPFAGYGIGKVSGGIIDYCTSNVESTYSTILKKAGGIIGLCISAICGNTLYTMYTGLMRENKTIVQINTNE